MERYLRAGAALFNAGRFAATRAVWDAGYAATETPLLSGLAHMAAVFAAGRSSPPTITDDGEAISLDALRFPAAAVAAEPLADHAGYDTAVVAAAVDYAHADREADARGPFVGLVVDLVRREDRALVYRRLAAHVDRRQSRERDVADLFE
jgi:hypothetical protein